MRLFPRQGKPVYFKPPISQPIVGALEASTLLRPPLSWPSASGLRHGKPCPICWNRPSQAAPIVVWAASSPACCCWKEGSCGNQSTTSSTCQPLWGGGLLERITSRAGNLEGGGEEWRKKGKLLRLPIGHSHVLAWPIVPTFFCGPAFPRGPFRPILAHFSFSLPLLGPGEMPAFPFSVPSAFWAPPWPTPNTHRHQLETGLGQAV